MNDEAKRKKLRKYFAKSNWRLPCTLIVLGVLCFLLALSIGNERGAVAVIAVGLMGLGLVILIIFGITRSEKPSDKQVDRWLEEDLEVIAKNSLRRLNLDESQILRKDLTVIGPILWSTTGIPEQDLIWRKGKDGIVRFAVYHVTVIQLADRLLAAYSCDFNFLKNVLLNEGTDEYHYHDIVSVSTQEISTSYVLPNRSKLIRAQTFRVSVSSGESIQVIVGSEELSKLTQGTIPTSTVDSTVRVIRTMLREKKE